MNTTYCLDALQFHWEHNSIPPEIIWPGPGEVLWIRGDSSVFPLETNDYFCIQGIIQAIPFMTYSTLEQLKTITR